MKYDYSYVALPKIYHLLEPYEWILFTVLFDEWNMMKNEEGWFFRSEEELSNDSCLSISTVKRRIKTLEQKDIIEVIRHNDGKKTANYKKANDYRINMDKVNELSKKVVCKNPFNENGENNASFNQEKVVCQNPFNKKEGGLSDKEGGLSDKEGGLSELPTKDKRTKEKNINNNLLQDISPETKDNKEKPEYDKPEQDMDKQLQEDEEKMIISKTQEEYDKALEVLAQHLKEIETKTSTEEYKKFRQKVVEWYKNNLHKLTFDKRNKPVQEETKKQIPKTLEDFITYDLKKAQERDDFSLDSGFEKYLTKDGRVNCSKIDEKINEAFNGMLHTTNEACYNDRLANLSKYVDCLTEFMDEDNCDSFIRLMNKRLDDVKKYRKDKHIKFKQYDNEE